jgi:REP element-mobilizing transposase RayT
MPWNDTDIPLAVFFTFRTYGTWLHGDARGSVDRHNNVYATPRIPAQGRWKQHNESTMSRDSVVLKASQRRAVETAIRETCSKRRWHLVAINVRTNHVHCVITIGSYDPGRALGAIKANATRQMKEDGCWVDDVTPWAEKGSCRRLWNERSVSEASDYVINRQGVDLREYDWW